MMANLSSNSIWFFLLILYFVPEFQAGTLSDSGIKGPPHITGPVVPRQTFRLGETIRLECPIHGIPSPILEWLKDDESITAGWERFKPTNHGLRIKDAILDDSGTYTCKGVNGFGSEQISFEVVIVDPNASSTEGPSIFGSHEADYIDSDGTWKKPLIGTAPQFNETFKSSETFLQLTIDSTLRLRCLAHGEPEPRIRWFKDNKEILDQRRTDRWGLQVIGVHLEDSGIYTCKAENHFGSINSSFHVKIIDPSQQKPEFLGHYPQNVTVMEGTTARLQCRILSQQSPVIQWLKKLDHISSYDLQHDRYSQQNRILRVDDWTYRVLRAGKPAFQADDGSYLDKLTIDHVTMEDAGTYVCAATNSIGYNYREAFVHVYSGSTSQVSNPLPTAAVVALPIGSVAIVALIAWIIYYVKTERRLQSRKESRRLEQQRHGDVGNKDLSLTAPCLPHGDQESNNRLPLPNNVQPNYMPYSTPYMEPIQQSKILHVYPTEALRMHNSANIRHTPRSCTSPSVNGSNPYQDPNNTVSSNNWNHVYRPPPCGRSPGLNHSVVSYPVESADSEHAYATVHNMNVNYSPYEDNRYNNHRRFMKRIDMV